MPFAWQALLLCRFWKWYIKISPVLHLIQNIKGRIDWASLKNRSLRDESSVRSQEKVFEDKLLHYKRLDQCKSSHQEYFGQKEKTQAERR